MHGQYKSVDSYNPSACNVSKGTNYPILYTNTIHQINKSTLNNNSGTVNPLHGGSDHEVL